MAWPLEFRGRDEGVKSIPKQTPVVRFISVFIVGALLLMMSSAPPARLRAQTTTTTTTAGGIKNFVRFNPPPFDFNDAFYAANGIDVNHLDAPGAGRFGFFRQTGPPAFQPGQVNWVVDNSENDPNRKNIRILATTGGYIDDGTGAPTEFISIIAFVL